MSAPTTPAAGGATPRRIPADRYRSRAWHDLEAERLWPRVWQIACNVDCVREPGDWFEYEIGRLSILVVRGDDGALRAFQNACRHRGSSLLHGSGRGLCEIRCPYHHWRLGDVVVWDERCTQHFAVADSLPERREMGRAVVRAVDA